MLMFMMLLINVYDYSFLLIISIVLREVEIINGYNDRKLCILKVDGKTYYYYLTLYTQEILLS